MATSSPYSQNDYQVFNARPTNLPVNDILKAFVSKNEYWKLGAEQVKNRFDSVLDLDLTKDENRKIRDEFIQKSQQDLQKLNSQDLSDPNVKKAGMKIFDPILQDPGILYDDHATKHYKKVLSDADRYRNEDGGKYYNEDNVKYALDGWEDFVNSPDRMAGKEFLRKAKEYTPYYNFQDEIPAIMKECKPSSASSDVINGMYNETHSLETRTAQQVTGCLDSGLSPKAKQQISIHGYARYKNNPEALRDSYLPLVSGQAQNLGVENARINGILANKDKLSSMSEDELKKMGINKAMLNPEFVKNLEAQRDDNDLRLDNLHKTINTLASGDISPISGDNFDQIAGAVYSKDYLQNYGRGFEYSKSVDSKKGDNVQLQIFHENKTDARQEDNQNFEFKKLGAQQRFDLGMQKDQQEFEYGLESMKAQTKMQTEMFKASLKAGNLKNANLTGDDLENARHFNNAFEDNVAKDDNYDEIVKKQQSITSEKIDLNNRFISNVSNIPGFPKGRSPKDPEFKEWYKAYTQTLPKDDPMWKVITPYEKRMQSLKAQEEILRNDQEDIDKTLHETNRHLFDKSFLKDIKDVTPDGVNAFDIQNLLEGRSVKGIDVRKERYTGPHSDGNMTIDVLYKNGQRIPDNSPIRNLYTKVSGLNNKNILDLRAKRNELAKDKTTLQTEGYTFTQLNEKDSPFKLRVGQRLDVAESNIDNITIGDTDLKGNFIITINPDNKDKNFQSSTVKKLKERFSNNIREVKGSENSFVVSGFSNFDIIDTKRISNVYNPIIRGLEKRVGFGNPKSTGLIRASDPRYFYGLEVQPGLTSESYTYRIYNNKNETKDISYDRKEALRRLEHYLDPNEK